MISGTSILADLSGRFLDFGSKIKPMYESIQAQFSALNQPLKRIKPHQILMHYFEKELEENPTLLAETDLFPLLETFGLSSKELPKTRQEIDKSLDKLAIEKTGYPFDKVSKLVLRNELILSILLFSAKRGKKWALQKI